MVLEDEDAAFEPVGIDDDTVAVVNGQTWAVVGRFLTTKLVKLEYMRQVRDGALPASVALDSLDMWVQLHDLPMGYTTGMVLEQIGNHIGTFVKLDDRYAGAPWKTFYRVRVSLPVDKPIKRRMRLMKRDKSTCWVTFKYERLHNFCFFCGLLGHSHKFCLKAREAAIPVELYPYDATLWAGGSSGPRPVGERWLVPAKGPNPLDSMPEVEPVVNHVRAQQAEPAVVEVSKRRREGSNGSSRRSGGAGGDVTMIDVPKNLQ
ncbi:uncharacterized protein LOC116003906 [Ipomoea triloba]|uniref:uncharacterized protein LOC116003906 n=1 Tax=Ipomoea triloba TaxID=35885 RepID=UPI00125D92F7|nr:uncharacterized protein LOC116003906 [Ipomoea triloba]